MLGLLGCGFLVAGLVCGAVFGGVQMTLQIKAANDQKEMAEEQQALQKEQQAKTENKEDKFNAYKERLASKQTLETTMKASAMIGRVEKQAEDARNGTLRNRRKALKEGHGLGRKRVQTSRPSYNNGRPAAA